MDEQKLVCIIEDNKPIRKLFCTLLNKAGLRTIDFEDGKSAFEWIKDNKPDCIITDILLPGIDGTELLKQIRKLPNGSQFPIISVTGFAQSDDEQKYLEEGFDYFISKPINTASFADEIKKVIEQKV